MLVGHFAPWLDQQACTMAEFYGVLDRIPKLMKWLNPKDADGLEEMAERAERESAVKAKYGVSPETPEES